jgi:hypothetical protein
MANGIKRLQKIQWGRETTGGTAVPATAIWRGKGGMLDDQRKVNKVEEIIGVLPDTTRTNVSQLLGMMSLAECVATYDQIQYLFAMGFGGPITGAADGVGTDKIYTTNLPTTSVPTARPHTIEGGDNFEVEQMEYALCTKIALSGAAGEEMKVSADIMGRQVSRLGAGFTGAITIPAVEDILFQKVKVYLDPTSGAFGATQVSNVVAGLKLEISIKWKPEFTGDGVLYYTVANFVGYEIKGEVLYIHDTAVGGATGAKTFFRNQVAKLLRMDWTGSPVATGGTTYQAKHLIIDVPIVFDKVSPLGDKEGTGTVLMNFFSGYDPTAGNAGKSIVVTETASLA